MVVLGVVKVFGRIVIDTHTAPGTETVRAMVMLAVAVIVILTVVVTTVIEFVATTVVVAVVVAWQGRGTVDQTLAHPYDE